MTRILWADDEIELLKPHVMFLENKGYQVTTVQSGNDAIDVVKEENFDIVFLDECGFDNFYTNARGWKLKGTGPIILKEAKKSGNITLLLAISLRLGVVCTNS